MSESSPHHGLFRSTVIIGACTGLSRLLGFAREVLMAQAFGTSLAKSAFDVAFRIPNLFRRLFGEGALSAAFVPVFAETLAREGQAEAVRLMNRIMTMLGTTLLMIVAGGALVTTVALRDPAALGERAAAVLPLLRIMLPYMFFICLVALFMAVLNAFRHFAVPAATPVVLNVVWIGVLLFVCPRVGGSLDARVSAVAVGIVGAGVIQLCVQLPVLAHYGVRPRLAFSWRDAHVRRVLLLMAPAALGMGIHQVNVCIDGLLALWAGRWAPAALTFAERLIYLPLGVFATALGTVLLPTYSHQAAAGNHGEIRRTLSESICNLMFLMVPASVGLLVLAAPIVTLSFQWKGGLFDAESTLQTARALAFYAPGLAVFSLYKMIVPAFYALKDTRTPVRVGLLAVGLNLFLNIVFVITWPADYKHSGLALATVLASAFNGGVLAWILGRRIGSPGWGHIATRGLRALVASAVMAAVAVTVEYGCRMGLAHTELPAKLCQLVAVGLAIASAVVTYAAAAMVLCRPEMNTVRRLLRRRRRS